MKTTFDPYQEWLKIASDRRPPSWYDLLSLDQYESDIDRIEIGYYTNYTTVRRYEGGTFDELAQRLLGELGEAYRGLTNPEEKSRYDSDLRRRETAANSEEIDESWYVVAEMLLEFQRTNDIQILRRCEDLAQSADGPDGLTRLVKQAAAHGIGPHFFENRLREVADRRNVAVCGDCFSFVPQPQREPHVIVTLDSKLDISCDLVRTTTQHGWLQNLVNIRATNFPPLESNDEICFSLRGILIVATFAALIPSMLGLTIASMFRPSVSEMAWTLSGAYVVTMLFITLFYRPLFSNGVEAAWSVIVPILLKHSLDPRVSSFLAGLSTASTQTSSRSKRRAALKNCIEQMMNAAATGAIPEDHLHDVLRLAFHDSIGSQIDIARFRHYITQLFDGCLRGWLRVEALDFCLRYGDLIRALSAEQAMEIRFLFLRACHGYSLKVADVSEIWQHSRAIRRLMPWPKEVMANYVSGFHRILTANAKPMDFKSALDFAEARDFRFLAAHSDVLFFDERFDIKITARGIEFRGKTFDAPLEIKYWARPVADRKSDGPTEEFVVQINGTSVIVTDGVYQVVAYLNTISKWYFERFVPFVDASIAQTTSPQIKDWLSRRAVPCPECGHKLVFARGEIA